MGDGLQLLPIRYLELQSAYVQNSVVKYYMNPWE